MTTAISCPICFQAMYQVEGLDGVWRCHVNSTHEFYGYSSAEQARLAGQARRGYIQSETGIACPVCRCTMDPVPGTAGAWRCVETPEHEFVAGFSAESPKDESPAVPALKPMGRTPQIELAAPFWLHHLGLDGPLPAVPQANITDGTRCLLLGSVERGGGSKSGRRRKKPPKGGQKHMDPWAM